MSTHRVRNELFCFVLAAMVLMPSGVVGATRLASSSASDAALAAKVNLTVNDLPRTIKWSTTSPTPNSASTMAQGRQAIACMKATGGVATKISPDLFGIVGKSGGVVTADVESSMFSKSGSSDGLPAADSDVVFVTKAVQATLDLTAMSTKADLACFSKTLAAAIGKNTRVAVTRSSRPAFGAGNGGVHVRFAISGGGLPDTIYADVYFYVEGRAEISLLFGSETAPFSSSSTNSAVVKIMTRARMVLG